LQLKIELQGDGVMRVEMVHAFAYLIYHRHEADGLGPEEGARKNWFLIANGVHLLE
jgi:hypothetical protein